MAPSILIWSSYLTAGLFSTTLCTAHFSSNSFFSSGLVSTFSCFHLCEVLHYFQAMRWLNFRDHKQDFLFFHQNKGFWLLFPLLGIFFLELCYQGNCRSMFGQGKKGHSVLICFIQQTLASGSQLNLIDLDQEHLTEVDFILISRSQSDGKAGLELLSHHACHCRQDFFIASLISVYIYIYIFIFNFSC